VDLLTSAAFCCYLQQISAAHFPPAALQLFSQLQIRPSLSRAC
jgi:hypothetical protein